MMARHLFALFALLSGIAALQAPAHAGEVQSSVQDSRSVANESEKSASESCVRAAQSQTRESRRKKREQNRACARPPVWRLPSIIFGSDRALE